MNLAEALDAALPEIPRERLSRSRPPQLDPDLVTHEDSPRWRTDDRSSTARQEQLLSLSARHSGSSRGCSMARGRTKRSPRFIRVRSGLPLGSSKFESLPNSWMSAGLTYETHLEKNLAMRDKLLAQRGRRSKSKINIAHISFSAWDPDRYLDWLDRGSGPLYLQPLVRTDRPASVCI